VVSKLVNFCLSWTLVVGCWGGVVAAAFCPHEGCGTATAATEHESDHGGHQAVEGQESGDPEEHAAHAEGHRGHAPEQPTADEARSETAGSVVGTSGAHDPCCSHCMGRPEAPPSPKFEWQPSPVEKAGKDLAAHSPLKFAASAPHVRRDTPAQHAPPGSSDRYLLISVFRI
jgi:hypothetical protein